MNSYKVIVFDLGNVLIPFNYNIIIDKLNIKEPGLGNRFYKIYKDNYHIHRQFETWELSNDEFLSIMLDWAEHKVDKEEFCHLYSDIFEVNPDTTALLPKLKVNYKLVLLSNTNYIHQKYGWEKYDFLKHFDKLILSHEAGAIKPDPKIYEAVMKFTGEAPQNHIFIDDVAEYVQGAKNVGWDAVQYTTFDVLTEDLKKRNIIF